MFVQLVFCACALVSVHGNALNHGVALVNTGTSVSSREQDGHGNYAFSYDIVDAKGASNSRSEVGDAYGNKKGSYTLHDIDGRARQVDYVADKLGFRVVVNTNEPGTAHSAPAAAIIASPYEDPSAPIVRKHIAPVALAAVQPVDIGVGHGVGYVGGHGVGVGLNALGYGIDHGYGAAHGHGADLGYGAAHGYGVDHGYGIDHGYEYDHGYGADYGYGVDHYGADVLHSGHHY